MANGDLIFGGDLVSDRFMVPLKHVHSKLTKQDIEYLAEHTKTAEIETTKDERNPYFTKRTVTITFAPLMRAMLRSCPEIV